MLRELEGFQESSQEYQMGIFQYQNKRNFEQEESS